MEHLACSDELEECERLAAALQWRYEALAAEADAHCRALLRAGRRGPLLRLIHGS